MRSILTKVFLIGVTGLGPTLWATPVVTLTLDPANGAVSGAPGATVGWGFTLTTDSNFIVIDSFNFQDLTPVGTFTTFAPPAQSASFGNPPTAPFDPINLTGVGQYQIGTFRQERQLPASSRSPTMSLIPIRSRIRTPTTCFPG